MDSVEERHTDVPRECWTLLRSKMKDGDLDEEEKKIKNVSGM